MKRITIDTNIFAYAEGVRRTDGDNIKIEQARAFLKSLIETDVDLVATAQVLAELRHVLCRKMPMSGAEANGCLARWQGLETVVATDTKVLAEAFTLAAKHCLQTYDAIILSAAAQAGWDTIYSEDMQHGFVWRGVEVVNPFV